MEQLGNMMASRQLEAAPTSLSVYHQRVEQLELEREELEAMVGGGMRKQIFSGHIKYFQVEERDAQLASIRNSISVLNAEYMADLASVREECQELGRSVQVG